MTALRVACSAVDGVLFLDGPLTFINGAPYTIDSEVVEVRGGSGTPNISVTRGIGGSTAASHLSGAALTAANAFSGGGGGVTVTAAASDPGAIGAGNFWLKTLQDDDEDVSNFPLLVRNATDDGWLEAGFGEQVGRQGNINTWSQDSSVNAFVDITPFGTGSASFGLTNADGATTLALSSTAILFKFKGAEALQIGTAGWHLGSTGPGVVFGAGDPGGLTDAAGSLYLSTADGSVWRKPVAGAGNWELVNPFVQAAIVGDLAMTASDPPTQQEVQDTADKVDALLASLRTAGLLAS